jgi:pilus assembly protein Flp/PilA
MRENILKLCTKLHSLKDALVENQSGQDLIEYALVAALIALAATAGMSSVATSIGTAFTGVGTRLATYTS